MTHHRMNDCLLKTTLLLAIAAMGSLPAVPTFAQFWNGSADNDWHKGANWDGGAVPGFGDNAVIASNVNSNTVADLFADNAEADGMFVGLEVNGSIVDGTVNHSAFTADFTNGMVIGRGGATGTYNQSGPSIVNTGFVAVGSEDANAAITEGIGFYNLSGDATLNASSFVIMGELAFSTGTMTLNDNAVLNANWDKLGEGDVSLVVGREFSEGTLNIHDSAIVNAADRIHVGDFLGARGTVNQDGNSVVTSKTVWLGSFDGGGQGTEGTYNLSGSARLNTNNVIVGRDGGKGTFNVQDSAAMTVTGPMVVGDFNGGNGVVNQSGGDVAISEWLGVGNQTGTTGEYNMTGGSLSTTNDMKIGDFGTGTFTHDAGAVNAGSFLAVGVEAGATGTYTQNGGTVTAGTDILVGFNGGQGTYTQNDGSVTVNSWLRIGDAAGSTGTYNLSGGTLDITGEIRMGHLGGDGTINQTGGTVNSGWIQIGDGSGEISPGNPANSGSGTYNISGNSVLNVTNGHTGISIANTAGATGTMTQSDSSIVTTTADMLVGNVGTGTYNQNGGSVTVGVANDNQGAWLYVGNAAGSQGTYSMTAGSLDVNGRFVIGGNGGNGDFNLNGGTVIARNGGVDQNGNDQPGALVIGRTGGGKLTQTAGSVTVDYIDMGGDPGLTDNTQGGTYTMSGGSLTTTSSEGIRIGLNNDTGSGSVFSASGSSTIQSAGNLEVGRDSQGSFQLFGSSVVATFAGDLSTSTGTGKGFLGWGSDSAGVAALEIAGDVDVTGGLLQTVFVSFAGLPTAPITSPHDLLLIDNQGINPVTGELTYDQSLDGSNLQMLAQGDSLVDLAGQLGGNTYYISYAGLDGLGNDIYLTLNPIFADPDFDADGDVDGKDFLIWQSGFGSGTTQAEGDANGDGVVNGIDKAIWQAQFGRLTAPVVAALSAVPEPGCLALLATALLLSTGRRRRSQV